MRYGTSEYLSLGTLVPYHPLTVPSRSRSIPHQEFLLKRTSLSSSAVRIPYSSIHPPFTSDILPLSTSYNPAFLVVSIPLSHLNPNFTFIPHTSISFHSPPLTPPFTLYHLGNVRQSPCPGPYRTSTSFKPEEGLGQSSRVCLFFQGSRLSQDHHQGCQRYQGYQGGPRGRFSRRRGRRYGLQLLAILVGHPNEYSLVLLCRC